MKIFYYDTNSTLPDNLNNTLILTPDYYGTSYTYLWDDYDFKTTFKAFLFFKNEKHSLGQIKLLFKGVNNSHDYIKKSFKESNKSNLYKINKTGDNPFISLGEELEYYNKLNIIIKDKSVVKDLLSNLCDASYLIAQKNDYSQWPGFSESLQRDASENSILQHGFPTATGTYEKLTVFDLETELSEESRINFHFNTKDLLNGRINILVGKNGQGKTRTLQSLTNDFLSLNNKALSLPFRTKLIVVSFSPFENFLTEKEAFEERRSKFESRFDYNEEEKKERSERSDYINGYSYIGLKSDESRIDFENARHKSAVAFLEAILDDLENSWSRNFERVDLILKTLKLAIDFKEIAIKLNSGEIIEAIELPKFASKFSSMSELDKPKLEIVLLSVQNQPINLSSGQEIYSLMIPQIASEIVNESIILIDEPELYLHPELEVGLISMLDLILRETLSFAIIATHSAIIVREVRSKYVNIIRGNCEVIKPEIETFGGSLDTITGYVFNDYNKRKPFQELIEKLITSEKFKSPQEAIENLSKSVGDEALTYLYQLKRQENSND